LSDILFSYEVIISFFISITVFMILLVAFINTLYILKNYKQDRTTQLQYKLEKLSYLITTIVYISLIIKIIVLPYFTVTLEKLSTMISGAMCGAGVISANIYGEPLILLKLSLVILMMLWLTLNRYDLQSKGFIYFKLKMIFFLVIFFLLSIEIVLEYLFFTNLSTQNPVSCCSTLYNSTQYNNQLPFNISILELVISFYTLYILIMLSSYVKQRYLVAFLSPVYAYVSYLSIVYFFSSYIYELPSHRCPYCLLQSDYYFIGYAIYFSMIIATYYALSSFFFVDRDKEVFYKSMFWYSIATFFISFNFVYYILINRTFL